MTKIVNLGKEKEVTFTPELARHLLGLGRGGDYTVLDDSGNSIKVEKDILRLTKFDLQSIPHDAHDGEIIKMINTDLGIDVTTPEGLEAVNRSFRAAINLYGGLQLRQVFERKNAPYSLIQNEEGFSSMQELLNFIRKAGIHSWENRLYCLIIKVTSAVHDYISGPLNKLNLTDANFGTLVFNALGLMAEDGDKQYKGYIAGIPIHVYGEPKSQESSVGKSLSNPKYHSSEKILDGIRYTFHLGGSANEKDALTVIGVIYGTLAGLNPIVIEKIDDKGIINYVERTAQAHTPGFDAALKKAVEAGKKHGTNGKYKEIKLIGRFEGTGFEIKVTLDKNENQDGLSFQGLYAYTTKYIGQQIRLASNGHISEEDLIGMSENFYSNIPHLIRVNPEVRDSKTPEILYDEIWNDLAKNHLVRTGMKLRDRAGRIRKSEFISGIVSYFKSKLYCVKLDNGKMVWTDSRGILLSQHGFYPDMDRRLASKKVQKEDERRKVISTVSLTIDETSSPTLPLGQ